MVIGGFDFLKFDGNYVMCCWGFYKKNDFSEFLACIKEVTNCFEKGFQETVLVACNLCIKNCISVWILYFGHATE